MGAASVASALKSVKSLLRPATACRRQLENRGIAESAIGRTVEIACVVEDHLGLRKSAICSPSEAIEHALRPAFARGCQLENDTAAHNATRASFDRCAVEVTRLIKNEFSNRRTSSSTALCKAIKRGFCPGAECRYTSCR